MKTFLKTSTAVLFTIILAGCSGDANEPVVPTNTDDHHEGEVNVAPHDDEPVAAKPPSRSNSADDHDDTDEEPHGH